MLSYLVPEGGKHKLLSFSYYKRLLSPPLQTEQPNPAEEILKAVGYSRMVAKRHGLKYNALVNEDKGELSIYGKHEAQVILLSPFIQMLYSITPGTNFKVSFNGTPIEIKTWIPIELTEEMVDKIITLGEIDEEFLIDAIRVKLVNPLLVGGEERVHALSNTAVQMYKLSRMAGISPHKLAESVFEDEDFKILSPVKEIKYLEKSVQIVLKDKRGILVEMV